MPNESNTHSPEFEGKVIDILARLDTKMDTLVGAPGQVGRVPKLEETVENLQKRVWVFSGAVIGISGVVHWLVDFLHLVKGH
jgi:hypothetical protein